MCGELGWESTNCSQVAFGLFLLSQKTGHLFNLSNGWVVKNSLFPSFLPPRQEFLGSLGPVSSKLKKRKRSLLSQVWPTLWGLFTPFYFLSPSRLFLLAKQPFLQIWRFWQVLQGGATCSICLKAKPVNSACSSLVWSLYTLVKFQKNTLGAFPHISSVDFSIHIPKTVQVLSQYVI